MPRTEIPCNFCFTAENMRNRKFIAYGRIESEVWKIDFCTLPTHNISKRTTILKLSVQAHEERRLEIREHNYSCYSLWKEEVGNQQPYPCLHCLLRTRTHSPNLITTTGHLQCARHKSKSLSHITTFNYNKPCEVDTSLL